MTAITGIIVAAITANCKGWILMSNHLKLKRSIQGGAAVVSTRANWDVSSPDGKTTLSVMKQNGGSLTYQVTRNHKIILENAPLGLSTSVADFQTGLTHQSQASKSIHENYSLVSGKKRECINHCNELTLTFKKKVYEIQVVFRAYNDGIAFRYNVPGEGSISIYSEASQFKIPSDTEAWAQKFIVNYEGFYDCHTLGEMDKGSYGMPLLLGYKDEEWALITEASVHGHYCASHLYSEDQTLQVVFANDQTNAAVSELPFRTPWRAVIIGTEMSDIVESDLVENLNPNCEFNDTSWIKPGRAAWSWWSGDSTSDYDTQTKYVDFASSMGWEYYLCDSGWKEEWLQKLIDYAQTKNVGIFVWSHHQDLKTDDDIQDSLSKWSAMGVKGIKVDFFDSDSQDTIRLYDKLAHETAKYRLLLNYHGSTKPSGERRRWPHLVTREGVLGAEYYKWSSGATAEHNCTLPFTRNVVGPMDYTPVTYSNCQGQTTFAHQTALCIIFESSVQHFADSVDSYETHAQQMLELLRKCPADWDETKLIEGYPGRYVTIARRKGDHWFVGFICGGDTSRKASVSLSFLEDGDYKAHIYKDGSIDREVIHEEQDVTCQTTFSVDLLPNGGCAMYISPA